ncbi:Sulfite exporter TauE/SafE [Kocuria rosea]|nr:Sulfite exporter TauE/SafE [Kocuria rosea]
MDTRGAGRSTVRGALGTAVRATVVNARGACRSAVGRALGAVVSTAVGATVGTAVVDTRGACRSAVRGALGTAVGTAVRAPVLDTPGAGRSTVGRALGSTVRTGTDISATALNTRSAEGSAVGGTFRLVRILLCISHFDLPDSSDRAVTGRSPGQAVLEQHRPARGYRCGAGEGTAGPQVIRTSRGSGTTCAVLAGGTISGRPPEVAQFTHPLPATGRCWMTGLELAVVALVVSIASCLQGAIGFGVALLSAPVIALFDPTLLPGSLLLVVTGLTALGVLRDRAAVDVKDAGWAVAGQVPGTVAGALLVAALSARTLALVLASTVLLAVLLSVCGWRPRPRPAAVVVAGAASGLLGTATSIGGPPMALVWHGSSRARMRGTMSAFFLVGAVMALVALTVVGSLDRRTVLFAAALLPAMVLGFAVSGAVNARINRRIVRRVGLGASALGAVLVLLQAL